MPGSRAIGAAVLLVAFLSAEAAAPARPEHGCTLIFGGDVLLDRGVRREITARRDPAYPFGGIAPLLRAADGAVANLECALSDSGTLIEKRFMFRGDPRLAHELGPAGFTAMSLANNHAYDCGRAGLMETALNLERAGILPLGMGNNQVEARRPTCLTLGGVRVALLAFVDMPLEGLMPLSDLPGPAQADRAGVAASIREARREADCVVVTIHWGREYETGPDERQRRLAREMVEAGADLVIGHHPHVIQPAERIGHSLVFYSVGNLVFDQTRSACSEGLLVRAELKPEAERAAVAPGRDVTGETEISVVPVRIVNCRPRPADPVDAGDIMGRFGAGCDSVAFRPRPDGWWTLH